MAKAKDLVSKAKNLDSKAKDFVSKAKDLVSKAKDFIVDKYKTAAVSPFAFKNRCQNSFTLKGNLRVQGQGLGLRPRPRT